MLWSLEYLHIALLVVDWGITAFFHSHHGELAANGLLQPGGAHPAAIIAFVMS
jgi:hypothetical protein